MNRELWQKFRGQVGEEVGSEFKNIEENGISWPYVKNDKQGEVIYNVRGDFNNGVLYMSCEHDGDFAYGRIDSPIADPPMIDRCLGMDPDDATFCNWLSDMILSTQFEGCTEEQILKSWEEDF